MTRRARMKATWWEDRPDVDLPPSEDVEIVVEFDGEALTIEGLRASHLLSIDLADLIAAMGAAGPGRAEAFMAPD